MPIVEVSHISKTYGDRKVVDDVSFVVEPGEVLGLIGPNGAGKTTTIRIMMDLIKPDSGAVSVLGDTRGEAARNGVGYLPEERGLYKEMTVHESLVYLATLKGTERSRAAARADALLERIDMAPHRGKRIKELSRGMGQFVQFLVTIIHEPALVVLDEPFANLDPVNTELIKEMVIELRNGGRAIVLSTHRMNEIEELCDRILMVNDGQTVLHGDLAEIKARYRSNSVILECDGALGDVPGVTRRREDGAATELFLSGETNPQRVLEELVRQGVSIRRFEVATPPLHEIFLQVVSEGR